MKRPDAFRKIRTICQRLDDLTEEQVIEFRARPLELYLFGSVLTDKSQPDDIDLVLVYDELTELVTPTELIAILSYGKPSPWQRLSVHLRRGMKMVRLASAVDTIADWSDLCLFPRAQGLHLIWQPGLNWTVILDPLEANPVSWPGPRAEHETARAQIGWEAWPAEEQEQLITEILAALEAQKHMLKQQSRDLATHE